MDCELWEDDESNAFFPVPSESRAMTMDGPNAHLIWRISADSWEEAKRLQDEYLYGGGRQKLGSLDIPASTFQITSYPCGLRAGDILELVEEHPITDSEGRPYKSFPKGARFRVCPGDSSFPHTLWARRLDDGIGQYHTVRDFETVQQCYRKL